MNRIGHSLLAALLLLSSTGILLNKHYCQGVFRSQALFFQPPTCHEVVRTGAPACPHHQKIQKPEKGCCDTRAEFYKVDTPQLHSFFMIKWGTAPVACLPPVPSLALTNYFVWVLLPQQQWGADLPPPGISRQVLFQVFRI